LMFFKMDSATLKNLSEFLHDTFSGFRL
jgi:hypothetical protein